MKPNGFPKAEHLCLQRQIEALFAHPDDHATVWPLRCIWRKADEGCNKMLVSVAKRRLHHAVDRNHAKRQVREFYRLNKYLITSDADTSFPLHVGFVWLADRPIDSEKVEKSIVHLLEKCRNWKERISASENESLQEKQEL